MDPQQPILAGIRIVDMTSVIFGPYATMMLADLGADVIKVEPTTGDAFRAAGAPVHTPGMGACTMTLNRGKRSIALDLKRDDDRAVMRDLLATADVFIHNVRADAIERLGFDYASVQALKPDIVYVHCVGFGSNGPYAELQAYDDLIQGLTACTDLLRHADGNPKQRYLPMAIADKVSGLYGMQAVQSGIIHKLRTGAGQFIEVPMFEAMTHFTFEEHLFGATFVPANGPILYQRQVSPTRQPYPTSDGHLCIVLYTDDKLVMFLNLVGRADVLGDPRFADRAGRLANMTALYVIIGEIIATRTTAEWVELCASVHIPAMPTHTTETVLTDPHLVATGFFRLCEHPSEGPYLQMQPPVRYGGAAQAELRPAPRIGEHSAEIRAELAARK